MDDREEAKAGAGTQVMSSVAPFMQESPLSKDLPHRLSAFEAGQALVEPLEAVGQPLVVQSEGGEQRGVKVAHVDFVHGRFEAELVALSVVQPAADAAAGQ